MIKLSPRQRQVVELRSQGLTYRQVAEKLGLSIETVKNHLAEAKKRGEICDMPKWTKLRLYHRAWDLTSIPDKEFFDEHTRRVSVYGRNYRSRGE